MSAIETQDTEPLTPDAARIVELERKLRVAEQTARYWAAELDECEAALKEQQPVMKAALELGRQWEANAGPFAPPELTDEELQRLNTLAATVKAFDALQPKG